MARTLVRAYASPGCVLLAFDWPDGKDHPDFLGFSILRDPGYGRDGRPQFLFNKLDFIPIAENARPKGSDKAPIQKFNWWDGGIDPKDRGRTFTYTITPMLGTGSGDLRPLAEAAGKVTVTVPQVQSGKIATWFNRAVVSAQSFTKLKNSGASLEKQMDWLADGIQDAIPGILKESEAFQCAIYHLTDQRWILPAFAAFPGEGSIIYFDKNNDHASAHGLEHLPENPRIARIPRKRIAKLMHNKFIVSHQAGEPRAVLMGSANFTPGAQTTQANLLHVIRSPQLARLYSARADLLASDPTTAKTAKGASWIDVTDVPGTELRVFFLPEPREERVFLDTVVAAVKAATSSVLFCMFTASDTALIEAIFAVGDDDDRLIYGLLNSISEPDQPAPGNPANPPPISVKIFNRSQTNPDTLSYDRFTKEDAPRGFLPELAAIDTSKYSGGEQGAPIAIHVHHKFIVIDGNTDHPTIYTGSPNFSRSAENSNDENVLEIKGNTDLARIYVAEFMRLYNHYRARALWDKFHSERQAAAVRLAAAAGERTALVLAGTRDGWAKSAYRPGTKAFLARTTFL